MTSKEKTFSALNSYFLNTATMKINESYFTDSLQILLDNTRHLYEATRHSKRKPHSVAWEAFIFLANECLQMIEYPAKYNCSSDQLKKWLQEYGRGYDSLSDVIAYIEEEREEAKKEAQNNEKQ